LPVDRASLEVEDVSNVQLVLNPLNVVHHEEVERLSLLLVFDFKGKNTVDLRY
jgi:hypothetical protein